jgi:hypothetical protein
MTEKAEAGDTAISIVFHKPLDQWTADDRKVILKRLKTFMRDQCGQKPVKPKRKVDPRQGDLVEWLDAKAR